MTIEDIIKANTAALIENTAALREILSVGASTAAVQAVPETVKKTRAKAGSEIPILGKCPDVLPLRVSFERDISEHVKEETLEESVAKFHKEVNDAPEPECPAPDEDSPSDLDIEPTPYDTGGTVEIAVPNLPPTELRAKLKEEIKLRIMGDPVFNKHFKATREKYGVELVKEIPDDQLPAFYAEVLG